MISHLNLDPPSSSPVSAQYSTFGQWRTIESNSAGSNDKTSSNCTGLSQNQNRLLYLIDLHTKQAEDRDGSDRWIRKQALSVLIYEGIIEEALEYDYAPLSALINNRRVWINVSQEGQSDIEHLRDQKFINALQV